MIKMRRKFKTPQRVLRISARSHALIHLQNIGELWLIDFGCSNGTSLNKRRIHLPVQLSDGDQLASFNELELYF
jgi:hypothetical protein